MIIYIVGDNGRRPKAASRARSTRTPFFNSIVENVEDNLKHIDELGGPKHFNHFPAGWAWAMNTPFQWTKQVASHFGGTRNPMVVSWPARIKDNGGRAQPVPPRHRHRADDPRSGRRAGSRHPQRRARRNRSKASAWPTPSTTPKAADRRRAQYFEMFINRGIYNNGWLASSLSFVPGALSARASTSIWQSGSFIPYSPDAAACG